MFPTKSTGVSRRVLQQHRKTDTSREAMLKHTRKSTPGRLPDDSRGRTSVEPKGPSIPLLTACHHRSGGLLWPSRPCRRVHYNSCPSMATLESPAELPAKSIEGWSPTTSGRRTTGRVIPGFITGLHSWIFTFFILALYLALSGFLSGTLFTSPTYCFGDAHLNV